MANLIVGIPFGGTRGAGVRPFVTGGVGLIRSRFDDGFFLSDGVAQNNLGWNLGAGVMGYFSNHVGVRGDVRHIRSTGENDLLDTLDLSNEKLRYWRATIGLVIR